MLYREIFAHPDKLAKLIQKEMHADFETIIKHIAKEFIEDTEWDIHWAYEYFSAVYDELYYAFLFEKIHLPEKTRDLLEFLATPRSENSPERERKAILHYIHWDSEKNINLNLPHYE